jgi:hypothetical protein
MIDSHGDGDSNKVFITVENGEAKIVLAWSVQLKSLYSYL